jgi:protein-tyrosine phosphatase
MTTTILTVCTGNICRSPLAEQLLRARLGDGFRVHSAGVGAMTGWPMDPDAADQSRAYGGDPDGFTARQLTAAIVDESDLILTATRSHRDEVVRRFPKAMRRTFSLAEFAALDEPDVATAAARRSTVRLSRGDDVVDPYGLQESVHAASAAQTDAFVTTIVDLLRPA